MRRRKGRSLRKTLISGFFLVLPMLITVFLLNFVVDKVDHNFTPWAIRLLPWIDGDGDGVPDGAWRLIVPFVGILASLIVLYVMGLIGSHYLGRRLIDSLEQTILRVPVIKGIYGSAKQLLDAFNVHKGDSFSRVVLVEYPRRGLYTLAFVTKAVHADLCGALDEGSLVFVFIPTTPNPTSGFLVAVPEKELIDTGLSIEAGLKTIVSGGMVRLGVDALPAPGAGGVASWPVPPEEDGDVAPPGAAS